MHSKRSTKIAAYAAAATALGGGAAHASIVYKSIEKQLLDKSASTTNTADVTAGIRFDGTSITVDTSTSAIAISAYDNYTIPKPAALTSNGNYVQTPELLSQGASIGDAFTQTQTTISFPEGSSGDHVYLGVSTPTKQYGWIRFSYSDGGKSITVHDAAFQTTPNQAITAGQGIPVPSTSGLGLLAGGLVLIRRRRSNTATQA